MEFGEIIWQLRNERKINQKELASVLGLNQATISAWELGKQYPPLNSKVLEVIADLYKIDINSLKSSIEKHYVTSSRKSYVIKEIDIITEPFFCRIEEIYGKLERKQDNKTKCKFMLDLTSTLEDFINKYETQVNE